MMQIDVDDARDKIAARGRKHRTELDCQKLGIPPLFLPRE